MAAGGQSDLSKAAAKALIEGAEVVPLQPRARGGAKRKPAPAPEPPADEQGGGDDGAVRDRRLLGDDCPVVPLGTCNGTFFYLDALRQLRALKDKDHDGRRIIGLFSPRSDMLESVFPRIGTKGRVTGWDKEKAGQLMMDACGEIGVWTPENKVRGAGAHRDANGALVLHCGDFIQVEQHDLAQQVYGATRTWVQPGVLDGYVYPAAPKMARPALKAASPAAARQILRVLKSWHWDRPEIDPHLCLGWIVGSLACGALDWRPMIWLTGGKGTGKSTLWRLVQLLLGENGLLHASEVTEAWVRQTLKMRTLPVALDEIEADADGRRVANIVKLARLASSGGKIGRGGADHEAQDFVMRSSFFFSSILHAPLAPQDKSRIAVLDLLPHQTKPQPASEEDDLAFDPDLLRDVAERLEVTAPSLLPLMKDNGEPILRPAFYGMLGQMLRRRLVDHWHRLDDVIECYREALAGNGHDARGQDQFGTLLACADLVLYDDAGEINHDTYAWWGQALAVNRADAAEDDEPMLVVQRMATTALPGRGGDEPETLAMWIAKVMAPTDDVLLHKRAQKRLEMAGLVVVQSWFDEKEGKRRIKRHAGGPLSPGAPREAYVAVAGSHQGMEQLLRETRWQSGVWNQALGRLTGAHKRQKVQLGGRPEWCTLVPIGKFSSDLPEDE